MTTIDLFLILLVFLVINMGWGLLLYVLVKTVKNELPFPKNQVEEPDRYVPLEEMHPAEVTEMFEEELRKINMFGSAKPDGPPNLP